MQGTGPGWTPKVGAGRCVGCPRRGSPSLAGDEEHWALVVLAELLCHCFWQRRLIKTRGAVGSGDVAGICQGPGCGRVSDLAGVCESLFAQPDMGTFPQKQHRGQVGRAGGLSKGLVPLSVHTLLCHNPELGWEPRAYLEWHRSEKRSPCEQTELCPARAEEQELIWPLAVTGVMNGANQAEESGHELL